MSAAFQFSDYVLDSRRFELRRGERTLKLEKIPMELLILLVERQGELVSRDEIVEKLWGKDVFLEADRGINTAVSKLRQALHDDPERPRYIQTVVGKGYRFIASISSLQSPIPINEQRTYDVAETPRTPTSAPPKSAQPVLGRNALIILSIALFLFALSAGYYVFRTGTVQSPQTLLFFHSSHLVPAPPMSTWSLEWPTA